MKSRIWNLKDANGRVFDDGLTAEEAGEAIVGYDGARWEIRAVGRDESNPEGYWYWALYWGSPMGEPLRQTPYFSLALDHAEAYREIMEDVANGPACNGVEAVPANCIHCECGAGDPSCAHTIVEDEGWWARIVEG